MKTNQIIQFNRLGLLLRRQVFSNGKSIGIAFGAITGMMLVITLLIAYFNPVALNNLHYLYFTALFIGGYIFSSNVYNELHQIQKSYSYLTLPVSTTERLLSGWIISGLLFPVVSLAAIAIVVILSGLVISLITGSIPAQDLIYHNSLSLIKTYVITQTIFLLGAVYFRKNNFLKTLLALFLFMVLINLYTGLVGWMLFGSFTQQGGMIVDETMVSQPMEKLFTTHFPNIASFVFNWLFGPFFLVTTWFGIKERQV